MKNCDARVLFTSVEFPSHGEAKRLRSVVLSAIEAEYIALSEVVKELKFIIQLLEINVQMLISVYVDNVGVIWLCCPPQAKKQNMYISGPHS